jgi:ATP-dependent Clp protease ATP-binding subunit ClpC
LVERCVRDAEVTGSNPAAPRVVNRGSPVIVFNRFSLEAKHVLRAAEQACRNYNHYYVGVEHLLLALLEQRDAEVDRRLSALGVQRGEVHATLRRALGMGDDRAWEGILVTPRLRAVFGLAEASAGCEKVEPFHLLDAISEEGGGLAAEILADARGYVRDSRRAAG